MLASLVPLFTHGLPEIQIHMEFLLMAVIFMNAGLPERHIALNCRKEPFDLK
jgi:hypothetical protein